METSKLKYNNIQKDRKIALLSETEIFFATNHNNGNLNTNYDFLPISGLQINKKDKLWKELTFEEFLKRTIMDSKDIECINCPFRENITIATFGCSLIDDSETKNYKSLESYTQDSCPIRRFREVHTVPTSFHEIKI